MGQFAPKLLIPSLMVFAFGFVLMGLAVIATRATPLPGSEAAKKVTYLPHRAALQQIEDFTDRIADYPQQCPGGSQLSEYRGRQCKEIWEDLWMSGVIASLPFVFLGIFLLWAFDSSGRVYMRVRRQVIQSKIAAEGTVTNPPVGRNDWFGWFYCLRSIVVQLKNQTQVRVYMPMTDRIPPAGSALTVYGGAKKWGKPRLFGVNFEALSGAVEIVSAKQRR